jgi:hypothetical protein
MLLRIFLLKQFMNKSKSKQVYYQKKKISLLDKVTNFYENKYVILIFVLIIIPFTVYLLQKTQTYIHNAADLPIVENSQTTLNINYDITTENQQFQRILNGKKILIPRDLSARTAIINTVPTSGENEGIVFVGNNVNIQYDPVDDEFTAEILTIDFNAAKTEAENWLIQQGLSKLGICNLPLSYTLSPEAQDGLPAGTAFSSTPLACSMNRIIIPLPTSPAL